MSSKKAIQNGKRQRMETETNRQEDTERMQDGWEAIEQEKMGKSQRKKEETNRRPDTEQRQDGWEATRKNGEKPEKGRRNK